MTVFIQKGDDPLTIIQATKRGTQIVAKELSAAGARAGDETIFSATAHEDLPQRLLDVLAALPGSPATYSDYAAEWESDNLINSANNLFNHRLAAYRQAVSRLAKYRLADGRAELTEEIETGQYNENGEPITETVVVATAIDPLPATVDVPLYDEATGEQTGIDTGPNPEIVQDDTERAIAQATIDAIPNEVKNYS